ncbi:restriction endonuclease subunit S [Streptomyces sp. NPDC013313]|uniref:restriction endonuclease subunit S n=1 Tax=Streptomyces sp. NPDC013313 TaxID=3155603 RepID=UPI0033DD794D
MARTTTVTGGRAATTGVIPGKWALSVGRPPTPAPAGFRWAPLSSVARLESGHTPSRRHPEYWGGDVPWIGIKDATGNHGRTIKRTLQTITQAGLDNSSARLLPAGTVCLSRTASVGYVVTMGVPMATSQDFINWVCGPEISSRYLHYILLMEQESVRRFAHGTTHQTVYFPEAKAFHVCIPGRAEQDRIAGVLGALDDKIAVNERIATTALDLALALYSRESSVAGWQPTLLGDAAHWYSGGTPKTSVAEYWGGTIPWISASSLKSPWIRDSDRCVTELGARNGTRLAAAQTILFVVRGMSLTSEFRVGITQREVTFGQDCKALIAKSGIDPVTLFLAVKSKEKKILSMVDLAGHGTGRLVTDRLASLPVQLPSGEVAASVFSKLTNPLIDRASIAGLEKQTLATLRDTLLPQLMSGRLRVKDAEKIVEDAT